MERLEYRPSVELRRGFREEAASAVHVLEDEDQRVVLGLVAAEAARLARDPDAALRNVPALPERRRAPARPPRDDGPRGAVGHGPALAADRRLGLQPGVVLGGDKACDGKDLRMRNTGMRLSLNTVETRD